MMSAIILMSESTRFSELPDEAKEQIARIEAVFTPNAMPNSIPSGGKKLMDILVNDSFTDEELPMGWEVLYLSKLVQPTYDEEGLELTGAWEVLVPLDKRYIKFLPDTDEEGTRPTVAFEAHRFAGYPKRF